MFVDNVRVNEDETKEKMIKEDCRELGKTTSDHDEIGQDGSKHVEEVPCTALLRASVWRRQSIMSSKSVRNTPYIQALVLQYTRVHAISTSTQMRSAVDRRSSTHRCSSQ